MNRVKNTNLESLGIILKVKKNSVIVMTNKLDFVELNRKPGMIRGQKVYFTSSDLHKSSLWFLNNKKFVKLASAVASVAAVFVMLIFGFRFLSSVSEYAYVDIDINPSIEITINRNENVLKAEALNNDGQILLDTVKIKNTELTDAVSLLLNKSKEIGFIDSYNNKVILTTAINSDKVSEKESENLKSMVSSLKEIADKSGLESQVIQLSYKDRKEAMESGLSMCKYYIYTKAKDEGIPMTVEEVRNSSISTLLSKVDISDNANNSQNPNVDIEPTPEPIVKPTSSQTIANTPNVTVAAPAVTDKPSYTSKPISTPKPSFMSEFTPAPTATTATNIVEPSITPYRTNIPSHTANYIPSTPKPITTASPTPSPKPAITAIVSYRPFPVVTPAKTPTPRAIATKSPTSKPIPTIKAPTSAPKNTPVQKTPTPIVYTATPKITIIPSSQPSMPINTPAPIVTIKPTPIATPTSTPTSKFTTTPTITPKSTPTLTSSPTPTPPATTTPTSTPTEKTSIKLGMYNEVRTDQAKEIHPRFKLINNGNTPIDLSSVKIRYYYTIDIEDKQQVFYCDWSNIGKNSVTGKLVKMSSSKKDADYYLEIGFDTTETLEPGSNIELICRIGPDNTIGDGNIFYNQLNDYSFNNTAVNFESWDKVTVYVSGSLLWGSEP